MRIAGQFEPSTLADVVAHLNEIRMGTIVSVSRNVFGGTPLPWMARGLQNDRIELLGHFAASNPQVKHILDQPTVFVTFLGPNAYVSPRGLPTPRSAPTWNFTAIHIAGQATILNPKDTEQAVETLVTEVERDRVEPWTSAEMGTRREQLLRHVVGVRLVSTRVDAKYKLGQNESLVDLPVIVQQLATAGHTRLVSMMRSANAPRLRPPCVPGDQ